MGLSTAVSSEQLTYEVDGRAIVDRVDVEIRCGEFVALVGPNGAGKSTLVALLCGDIRPTRGTTLMAGAPLTTLSSRQLALRRAVLVQRPSSAPDHRVVDIVMMGRHPRRRGFMSPRDVDSAVVQAAMEEAACAELASRLYRSLSGGEQARVQLARVLAQETDVLFLDEPTAALDLRHQHLVTMVARHRADAGGAVLAVLHDLALAAAYADRVIAMGHGRVVADGPPSEVLTSAQLTRLYHHPVAVGRHPTQDWNTPTPERID